ncbi:MAG: hypothetical protein R3B57_04340 [Phycisphaerales bacterium]
MGRDSFAPELRAYIERRAEEKGQIPAARRATIAELAAYVRGALARDGTADLIFVCTHNSRRSQFGQVWAHTAAAWHGVEGVRAFSGGTEVTAFNPRAIEALERAGFLIERGTGENPRVHVRCGVDDPGIECFSTLIDEAPNPDAGFAAVMTCSSADAACPIVPGAAARIALRYEDPKAADGTARETEVYNERCAQIARELLAAMGMVAG